MPFRRRRRSAWRCTVTASPAADLESSPQSIPADRVLLVPRMVTVWLVREQPDRSILHRYRCNSPDQDTEGSPYPAPGHCPN